jgi:hypothetical protein
MLRVCAKVLDDKERIEKSVEAKETLERLRLYNLHRHTIVFIESDYFTKSVNAF